jgi:hypothetical protein
VGARCAAALEGVLTDMLRVLGPDHPDTLITRANLARWRGEAGDPAGAAIAFEALLTDYLRVLGPDHPDTLTPILAQRIVPQSGGCIDYVRLV